MQKEYVRLIEEYCSLIKNHFRDRLISICLFGSIARGEAKPESDIDILIIDDFLRNVLLSIKENLKRLGAKKVVTGKGYYWVLKPDIKPGEIVRI